jgi:hypothetical protein
METQHTAHPQADTLVRGTFGDPANAAGFFQHYLEHSEASRVAWDSLCVENISAVDKEVEAIATDLLFSAHTTNGERLLYLFFEHECRDEDWRPLRLLNCAVRIWQQTSKTRPASASMIPILPIVLTQSGEGLKNVETFHSLFLQEGPVWELFKSYTPNFAYRIVHLKRLRFDEIRGTPAGILTLRALKASAGRGWLSDVVWDEELLARLTHRELEQWLRYMSGHEGGGADFRGKVSELRDPVLREAVLTLGQHIWE